MAMAKAARQNFTSRHSRTYTRNVLKDGLKEWAVWLPLNARYAAIYLVSGGGRLGLVPKRSELPLVAVLLLFWGFLSIGGLLFGDYGLVLWWLALSITCGYIVGAYMLFMEQPGATQIVGFTLAADIILLDGEGIGSIIAQSIKLLLFAIFLLVCVKDWRILVTLPNRPADPAAKKRPREEASAE
jgi:hypothetical protein